MGLYLKLACFSDTHGKGAVVPPCDAILHAGDAYNYLRKGHFGGDSNDFEAMGMFRYSGRLFAVRGNHDVSDPVDFFGKTHDVSRASAEIGDGIYVIGVGWAGNNFFDLPGEDDLARVCARALEVSAQIIPEGAPCVVLSHYPAFMPYKLGDGFIQAPLNQGWMFDCVMKVIEAVRPVLVVQGHMHELFGTTHKIALEGGEPLVVFPGPAGMLVEIDKAAMSAKVIEEKA